MTNAPVIAVLDYGIGNLRSAQKAFEHVGAKAFLTNQEDLILNADAIVLPGVGSFDTAIENLEKYYVKNLSSNWEKTSSWE